MQSLISVVLRMFYPVTHAVRLIPVNSSDYREYVITLVSLTFMRILCRIEDYADCIKVIYLLESQLFGDHLVPDRIRRFHPSFDLEIESGVCQCLPDRADELVDALLLVGQVSVNLRCDVVVCIRFFIAEPDVLHFRLHLIQTETVSQRHEDVHGLAQDLVTLVLRHEFYGTAVMQPVCKLDENYTHIIIESQENTLEILCLEAALSLSVLILLVLVIQHILDLRQTLYERCDFITEKMSDVIYSVIGVLHDVMEERG